MAKLLYTLKIVMLSDKIEEGLPKSSVFSGNQTQLLKRFAHVTVLCYVSWWLIAPISAAAPWILYVYSITFLNTPK